MTDDDQEQKRAARRARQKAQKAKRNKTRVDTAKSRQNNRSFKKPARSAPGPEETPTDANADQPAQASEIPVVQREFPLLRRYKNADPSHPHVRRTCIAFIRFNHIEDTGKNRPCVIVGATKSSYIVKPLYSEANMGAGFWRALPLREWAEAGLDHESWVGDEVHKVSKNVRFLGTVTLADWNSICLH